MLWFVIKKCQLHTVFIGFILCFFIFSLLLTLFDPNINNYLDALWYMFVSCTSIGFGDIVVGSYFGRILTIILTLYEIALVSVVAGVIVSFYIEVIQARQKETTTIFLDKLEHLSELSKEELKEIEDRVKSIR